ncbi:Re/Si-specific NAD(P)(+) transhydrogenase subunit alpha [Hyphomicrobiales bacterium]|nr:Re/Si-specific NAD(P)(+) transhydrogenase subunit alpha [Hyphomicrobiales bacterium]|tara:strand:- start:789 stop:1904 length:1116 start_codon:yes stop_codon:yes gene_type:complete
MKICILKETTENEKRVALVPDVAKKLINDGFEVSIETKAGELSNFSDEDYISSGATVGSAEKITSEADIIFSVRMPEINVINNMKANSSLIGLLNPYDNIDQLKLLSEKNINAFSMELVPRSPRAQSMDVLSSQSNLAGYKAIVDSSSMFNRAMPMMMTAAGTIAPAKIFIMGVGVAGLQAIATAKRMGAVVSATDVRRAAGEQCESLGASFIMVDEEEDSEDSGGYAKEMSEDYKKRQNELIAEHLKSQDIVICTALIPGRPAPILLTSEMVLSMKKGSVIVDMAVERGGNCELTKRNENILVEGIKIVGDLNIISGLAPDASNLYSRNLYSFLSLFVDLESEKKLNWDDEIVLAVSVVKDKKISEIFNK